MAFLHSVIDKQKMAAELVISATNEKLADVDWAKNIEICELVARDERQAKDVIKAVKKRLGSKNPNTQLYAVMLLEMLMNNIGENIHKQVIEVGILPILVKIVKKKSELPVRERIFLLLDATQTSLGGASGKFPQYYSAYYDLVHAGVKFPRRTHATPNPNPGSTQAAPRNTLNEQLASARKEGTAHQREPEPASPSSILQKASSALEVLKEVLDTIDSQINPEVAKDEFTLDLVEQCSFQKERVMHLVMTSRDERIVSQAIELNEELQRILTRHDDMLSGRIMESSSSTSNGYHHPHSEPGRSTSNGNHQKHELSASTTANHLHSESSSSISNSNLLNHEDDDEDEEEEPEQLFRRLRKGKARAKPEDEEETFSGERPPPGLLGSSIPGERLNRPLIRPLPSETRLDRNSQSPPVGIPPPPAKHMERERFFKEKKTDGSAISGHMRGLSLSSSRSGSLDFSD